MTFQVEITPIAASQIEKAYAWYRSHNPQYADRWFRDLMNTIATLQEQPRRCPLAIEHKLFLDEVRQLLYRQSQTVYRVLFTVRDIRVSVLYVRHSAQAPLTSDELQALEDEG